MKLLKRIEVAFLTFNVYLIESLGFLQVLTVRERKKQIAYFLPRILSFPRRLRGRKAPDARATSNLCCIFLHRVVVYFDCGRRNHNEQIPSEWRLPPQAEY